MTDEQAKALLELLELYVKTYGPEDEEIANGQIRLHAVMEDLEEST